MPTPPLTTNAPEFVDVELVVDLIVTAPSVSAMNNLDTAAVCRSNPFKVPSLVIRVLVLPPNATYWLIRVTIFPPTYKLPPIPTPPATCNAPVVVLVLDAVLEIDTRPVNGFMLNDEVVYIDRLFAV